MTRAVPPHELALQSTILAEAGRAPRPADAATLTAPAQPAADPMIGKVLLGQFVVRERIGEGGMGAVYLADQPAVGRSAVVKVLRQDLARGRGSAARFNVEARAASQLCHPNIVTIYNYSMTEDGTLFLVMEHLDGVSLRDVIAADAPLPPARTVAIVRQIAAALAEAHAGGVVHRDLKPSNIMLVQRAGSDELVKVLDFGVAKMDGVELTVTGFLCGTPPYMSPEQFREADVDGRSDLYSLAVLMFEMLTGRLPFVADSPVRYMQKHLQEAPPRPSSVATAADIPPWLDDLVFRTLSKEPSERPASVDSFMKELAGAMMPVAPPEPAPMAPTGHTRRPLLAPGASAIPSHAAAAAHRVRVRVSALGASAPAAVRRAWERVVAAVVSGASWMWQRTGGRLRRRRASLWARAFDTIAKRLRRRRSWRQRLRGLATSLGRRALWRRWFDR